MPTKHVLGYNRTVINKKPRRYTKNYNYREQQWKQSPTANHSEARDSKRPAKEPGWRPVYNSKGEVDHYYFERRVNRSDTRAQRNVALGYKANKHRTGYGRRRIIAQYRPKINIIEPEGPRTGGKIIKTIPKQKPQKSKLDALIHQTELSIHTQDRENSYTFDTTSDSIAYYNKGNKDSVYPGPLRGQQYISTHNHPNEYGVPNTFSGHDIRNLINRDIQETRACSFGYVYRLRPGTADVSKGGDYYMRSFSRSMHKRVREQLYSELGNFVYYEGEPIDETKKRRDEYYRKAEIIGRRIQEEALIDFCRKFGFWYKKDKL